MDAAISNLSHHCAIHVLLAFHSAHTLKYIANDGGLEMATVAIRADIRIRDMLLDKRINLLYLHLKDLLAAGHLAPSPKTTLGDAKRGYDSEMR